MKSEIRLDELLSSSIHRLLCAVCLFVGFQANPLVATPTLTADMDGPAWRGHYESGMLNGFRDADGNAFMVPGAWIAPEIGF